MSDHIDKMCLEIEALRQQVETLTHRLAEMACVNGALRADSEELANQLTTERAALEQEQLISDKLVAALKECGSNLGLTYKQIMTICNDALAELEAVRAYQT